MDEVLKWIILQPLAVVHNARQTLEDDQWGEVYSTIELVDEMPGAALDGLEGFSHIEVLFYFHRTPAADVVRGARHPRGNSLWPQVGIFAQRGKDRPNRLGPLSCGCCGAKSARCMLPASMPSTARRCWISSR